MVRSRAVLALLYLIGCSTVPAPRTVSHEETIYDSGSFSSDVPVTRGVPEVVSSDPSLGTIGVEPTTERVVGYVAIIGGVIACTILIIGFYKLVKLLGH